MSSVTTATMSSDMNMASSSAAINGCSRQIMEAAGMETCEETLQTSVDEGLGGSQSQSSYATNVRQDQEQEVPVDLSRANSPVNSDVDVEEIGETPEMIIERQRRENEALQEIQRLDMEDIRSRAWQACPYTPYEIRALLKTIVQVTERLKLRRGFEDIAKDMKWVRFWDAGRPSLIQVYQNRIKAMNKVACRDGPSLKRKWNKLVSSIAYYGRDFFFMNDYCIIPEVKDQDLLIDLAKACINIVPPKLPAIMRAYSRNVATALLLNSPLYGRSPDYNMSVMNTPQQNNESRQDQDPEDN